MSPFNIQPVVGHYFEMIKIWDIFVRIDAIIGLMLNINICTMTCDAKINFNRY